MGGAGREEKEIVVTTKQEGRKSGTRNLIQR
jgi:hypothetical protein